MPKTPPDLFVPIDHDSHALGDPFGDHPSGSHLIPATLFDVKDAKKTVEAVVEKRAEAQKTEITRIVTSADVKWFVATMCSVAVGAVLLVSWFDARGQAQVDAGVKTAHDELAAYQKITDERIADTKQAVAEVKQDTHQANVKIDALLLRFGVPNPAPTKVDGGP